MLMLVPPNQMAMTLFRVSLWILPSVFGAMCAITVSFLNRHGLSSPWNVILWLLLTSAFTIGAGYYNALLSNSAMLEPAGILAEPFSFPECRS